jgi:phage-related protein (TIGR01555 family)
VKPKKPSKLAKSNELKGRKALLKKLAPMKVSAETRALAKLKRLEGRWQGTYAAARGLFAPAKHPDGVKPDGLAMDDNGDLGAWGQWGARGIEASMLLEGQAFLGYPTLALMAQRTENRAIVGILSTEMTRKWVRITSKGKDKSKADKIAEIEDRFRDLGIQDEFRACAAGDGFFGRGHLFLQLKNGGWDDKDELLTSIGDGRDEISKEKVSPSNPLIAVKYIEAVWTYPIDYNTTNPLRDDWFKPFTWQVMGTRIHTTRLLRFVLNEVPDLLKPAYSFGGLSMSQMARPYVDYWLKTRSSIADLVRSFTVRVISTNLKATLQGGSDEGLYDRAELLTDMESNNGVVMLDKDTEEFNQISAPLGGLHELQAQSQEHMSLPGRVPTVKLSGISPTGLNASSEGELEAFDDTISSMQNALFKTHLRSVLGFVQLSLFGEIDDDIDFEFIPLVEERPLAKAQRRLTEAQYHAAYVEMGAVNGMEVRQALSEDPDSPYPGLEEEGAGGPAGDDPWAQLAQSFGAGQQDPWAQLSQSFGSKDPWDKLREAFLAKVGDKATDLGWRDFLLAHDEVPEFMKVILRPLQDESLKN